MVSTGPLDVDKCIETQIEEIEVLRSIYGNEWKTENEADRAYSIEINEGDLSVTLFVTLPPTYPYESPPTYMLMAPGMSREQKNQLTSQMDEVYLFVLSGVVNSMWIDKIKEYLSTLGLQLQNPLPDDDDETSYQEEVKGVEASSSGINIVHGEQIVDRKSTFQGHVAIVLSVHEVRQVLVELKKNKKIAKATHNIYAYRISNSDNTCIQDCDDDGETNAGGRLLHLLQILNVNNVVVIVTRWYGGILLGPVRFRHINNAARQVLEQAELISASEKKKT